MMANGVVWIELVYLFQMVCVVAYQMYTDPNFSRPPRFTKPFKGKQDRKAAVYELDPERCGYTPLNFFNLFWIFMIASVCGLVFEMVVCMCMNNVWKDRTGILWGPFSPIYGFGAMLMTIALNRIWYRNVPMIFVISSLIGAGFEFFVSWFFGMSFGVVAWSYDGAFLSICGRTDFAHFDRVGRVRGRVDTSDSAAHHAPR